MAYILPELPNRPLSPTLTHSNSVTASSWLFTHSLLHCIRRLLQEGRGGVVDVDGGGILVVVANAALVTVVDAC